VIEMASFSVDLFNGILMRSRVMRFVIYLSCIALILIAIQTSYPKEYVVDGQNPHSSDQNVGTVDQPLKTIRKAGEMAHAGDSVIVKAGVYREAIPLANSGTPHSPIRFIADPPGSVVITGADILTAWKPLPDQPSIYYVEWKYQFIIDHKKDGTPIEHHPENEPVWGRAEQVIVDGYQLAPVGALGELIKQVKQKQPSNAVSKIPNPKDPTTWFGMFAVDTTRKKLYIYLSDSSDPNKHQVESSSRGLIFGAASWINRNGIENVQVFGFIFKYGASFPQRPAVYLHGRNNLIENCVIEDMSGAGVGVGGAMKRCVIRRCGHIGGGASDDIDNFINEECLWEGNCWKPINRDWDAGGFKVTVSNGGVFRRCVFRHNGGPGLWFDIAVQNVLVTECVFQENELSGIFIEMSRDITVLHNLMIRNALNAESSISWSSGGVSIAESINCIVAFNTFIGNKHAVAFREHGPRIMWTKGYDAVTYNNKSDVILGNVCASNRDGQLGLLWDNSFFGRHPSEMGEYPTEEAFEKYLKTIPDKVYDPTKQNMVIDRNIYYAEPKQKMILYGVDWRPKYKEFADVGKFSEYTGFDAHSIVADPMFINAESGDYRFQQNSPAWTKQAGWLTAPSDIDKWMADFLPSFR